MLSEVFHRFPDPWLHLADNMEAQFALLEQFVKVCKADPSILHHPKLAFYREFIERCNLLFSNSLITRF